MAKEQPPFKVNDIVELQITGLGSSGEGVGKVQGFTVFVKGALPGETVKVKLFQVKKSYASGNILSVEQASSQRVEPPCPYYKTCGGCQLQHLSYEGQLAVKRRQVQDALERIGHIEGCEVLPVIGMANPWHYRNKMQFPVARPQGEILYCRHRCHTRFRAADSLRTVRCHRPFCSAIYYRRRRERENSKKIRFLDRGVRCHASERV